MMAARQFPSLHFFHSVVFHIFLLLHSSFVFRRCCAIEVDPASIPGCKPTSCGGTNITYPFWMVEPGSTAYCGDSRMGVNCVNNKDPVLETSVDSVRFQVLDINIHTQTARLVYADALQQDCPRVLNNLTSDAAFAYAPNSDANITFFLNCMPSELDHPLPFGHLPCLSAGSKQSYALLGINSSYSDLQCERVVQVPVLQSSLKALGTGNLSLAQGQLSDLLRDGFEVSWKPPGMKYCRVCEDSGGLCGYRNDWGHAFVCYCEQGKSKTFCGDKGRLSVLAKVGIAFAGLGVGILLTGTAVFLWRQRKRRLEKGNSSVTASSFFKSVTPTSSSYGFGGGDLESSVGEYYHTPTFTYEELEVATGGFAEELGDGGFGTVYKGKLKDGRIVAIKCLHENTNRRVVQFRNEIEILNRLRHQNLVTLYGCSTRDSPKLLLVYEFVPNGTVADHLHGARSGERALHWPLRMSVAIESAAALSYLHAVKPQIIHRDVKTSNILLDSDFHVKVADFGLSRLFPNLLGITHVSTAPQGTPGYVDPEYHQCYQLTDKSDVYSFGVVLVELVTSMPAVDISRKRNEINLSNLAMVKIAAGAVGEMADGGLGYGSDMEVTRMMKAVCELAFRCLQQEREMRPTMLEVLEELKRIESGENSYDQTKKKKDSPDSRDDVYLLNVADSQTGSTSSPPFSPNTVDGNSWPSRSTTPFASV